MEEASGAWEVVARLTEDPDPEADEDRSEYDPFSRAINTVRGWAMEDVVQYALWLRRHFEQEARRGELTAGFGSMPEVEAVLRRHLDPQVEKTRAIRSVYGRWFPWLVLLDARWAEANVASIFPHDTAQGLLWRAAWDAYIVFCPAYDSVLRILRSEYEKAVDQIPSEDGRESGSHDPSTQLSEHLMLYYLRGLVGIDESLFTRFWEKAPKRLAAHALSFIGRALSRDVSPIPNEVLDRARALWTRRYAVISAAGAGRAMEAAAFEWWFTSNVFEPSWALGELVRALKVSGGTMNDFRVIERLAEMAPGNPRAVVSALAAAIEGTEPWKIRGREKEVRTMLAQALGSGDNEASEQARAIVHNLGRRGYFDFRDLLGGRR
jgi:hypothetical protein